jgi:hypothetical protein
LISSMRAIGPFGSICESYFKLHVPSYSVMALISNFRVWL